MEIDLPLVRGTAESMDDRGYEQQVRDGGCRWGIYLETLAMGIAQYLAPSGYVG